MRLIEQVLPEEENPRRDHSLITIPHTNFVGDQWKVNRFLQYDEDQHHGMFYREIYKQVEAVGI